MYNKSVIYGLILIFSASCATPKAMDIRQAGDEVMTCKELLLAYESANLNEDIAHQNKGATDENILSGLFFFVGLYICNP